MVTQNHPGSVRLHHCILLTDQISLQGCQPSWIDCETHGFHSVITVSQWERYFSWLYFKSHYYRLNSHCFQLWKLVYSEVSSKKTTMYQKYALLHNIKLCILKMSVTYIMSSACSSDQLLYTLPVVDQIHSSRRDQWDLYYIYIHMTSPNFPSFQ